MEILIAGALSVKGDVSSTTLKKSTLPSLKIRKMSNLNLCPVWKMIIFLHLLNLELLFPCVKYYRTD